MDTLIRRDRFLRSPNLPYQMGCDMVGRVVQAGKGSTNYGISEGDRVCAVDFVLGGHSKYVVVPCYELIQVPHKVESAHAVCLLRPYVTAYQCLHDAGDRPIIAGDRVLVCGGTGAVGQAVVELALAAGARAVYATGKGAEIRKLLRAKGATVLGREPNEWLPTVEGRMDIVIDLVCSDGFSSSFKALRRDGTGKLVCVGATSKQNNESVIDNLVTSTAMSMAAYFMPNTTIYDFFASLENDPEGYRRDLRDLFRLLKENRISPRISKFVLLDEIAIAHKAIEQGGLNGHVICRPNPTSKFAYNGITKQKRTQSTGEARDDVSVSSEDGSDSEDETEYSRSIITNISGDSAFSSTYSTFDDSWSAYSKSTRGTTAPATDGFLSSRIKSHVVRRNTHGAAHGASAATALGAICEESVDPQSSSTRPKLDEALGKTNVAHNAITTSALLGVAGSADIAPGKDKKQKDASEKDQATSTAGVDTTNGPNDEETSDAAKGTSKHWLKRIPLVSKRKMATQEAPSEARYVPPAASERVITHPVPKGEVPSSGGVPSKKSHDCGEDEANETIEANGINAVPSTPKNDGPEEFLRYVASFFSTEEPSKSNGVEEVGKDISDLEEPAEASTKRSDTTSILDKAFSHFSAREAAVEEYGNENEDQKSAAGSIGSAIKDLLGIYLCANEDEVEGTRALDTPLHIVFPKDQQAEPDPDGSQGRSSTFLTSGVVSTREVSSSPQNAIRMESDEVSALTDTASLEPKSKLLGVRTDKPLPPARVKGLSKTAVQLPGTSSVPSSKGRRGQDTHKSHVSLARSISSVSIRCDSSQRQFHVPTSVASSVMSVSSSGALGGGTTKSSSRRNIYATRVRPNRSSAGPKPKGMSKKKKK